jgi:monoamine oxidase
VTPGEDGVVVIGAGLAAARHLRAHGVVTTLIEALPRIGGRAYTTLIGQDPFDHGATWLHDADRNPLVAYATPADALVDTGEARQERLTLSGRPASPAEHAAYDTAWSQIDQLTPTTPDETLAAALARLPQSEWSPLIALWEGPIIAAADPARLGLQDWHRNRLDGRNLAPRAGLGAYLASHLATEATLSTQANLVTWSGPGISIETTKGVIMAAAAIVTVSTGVLARQAIAFDPPLPPDLQETIHALPMGLLTKLALPCASGLGLPPSTVLIDRDATMTFIARPLGRAHLMAFIGGDALRHIAPAAVLTTWGTDPAFNGAYAYAGPHHFRHRAALAEAFPGDKLLFAGEATRADGLAGTVGGAYLSGIEAAERLLA